MYARPRRAPAACAAALLACAPLTSVPAQDEGSSAPSPAGATDDAESTDAPAAANGRSMTLEELEAYIAEQKAALEKVELNRRVTLEKAKQVEEELARRKAREVELREEMRALCEDRSAVVAEADEELDPGNCETDPAG